MAPGGQVVLGRTAVLVLPRACGEPCSTSKSVQCRRERSSGGCAECQTEVWGNGKRKGCMPGSVGVGAATRRGALKPPVRWGGGLDEAAPSAPHVKVKGTVQE